MNINDYIKAMDKLTPSDKLEERLFSDLEKISANQTEDELTVSGVEVVERRFDFRRLVRIAAMLVLVSGIGGTVWLMSKNIHEPPTIEDKPLVEVVTSTQTTSGTTITGSSLTTSYTVTTALTSAVDIYSDIFEITEITVYTETSSEITETTTIAAAEKTFFDYTFEELMEMPDEEIMNMSDIYMSYPLANGDMAERTTGALFTHYLKESRYMSNNLEQYDFNECNSVGFSFETSIAKRMSFIYPNITDEYTMAEFDSSQKDEIAQILHIPKSIINDNYKYTETYLNQEKAPYIVINLNLSVYGKDKAEKARALCLTFIDGNINPDLCYPNYDVLYYPDYYE